MTTLATPADARLDVAELGELLRTMNTVTSRLQETHVHLQEQVAVLKAELAEANEQLRRSRSLAALGEMAAGIAHEIRNPLGCLSLYAEALRDELAGSPRQAEMCGKMQSAVRRMDEVVTDVLAFARDFTLNVGPVLAADVIERAVSECQGLLDSGGVTLQRPLGGDVQVRLVADGGLLVSVLSNLIRNAAEAMIEAGSAVREIRIGVRRELKRCPDGRRAMRAVLSVEDTGPGIPAELRSRIFNPFFTTRASGTGLGLAIVHRVVDAHGGHLVVGTGVSGGTRFEVCLPSRPAGDRPGLKESGASLREAVSRRIAREHVA